MRLIVAFIAVCITSVAAPASADLFRFEFGGQFRLNDLDYDPAVVPAPAAVDPFLVENVSVGESYRAFMTVDTSIRDRDPSPQAGYYPRAIRNFGFSSHTLARSGVTSSQIGVGNYCDRCGAFIATIELAGQQEYVARASFRLGGQPFTSDLLVQGFYIGRSTVGSFDFFGISDDQTTSRYLFSDVQWIVVNRLEPDLEPVPETRTTLLLGIALCGLTGLQATKRARAGGC